MKELFAIRQAALRFLPLVGGTRAVGFTDRRNDCKVTTLPIAQAGEKVLRWWCDIQRANIAISFLAGKLNISDGFSRNPPDRDSALEKRADMLAHPERFDPAEYGGEEEDQEALDAFLVLAADARRPALRRLGVSYAELADSPHAFAFPACQLSATQVLPASLLRRSCLQALLLARRANQSARCASSTCPLRKALALSLMGALRSARPRAVL